jgi:hypothetical protein
MQPFYFKSIMFASFSTLVITLGGGGGGVGGFRYNQSMNLKESEQVKGSQLD